MATKLKLGKLSKWAHLGCTNGFCAYSADCWADKDNRFHFVVEGKGSKWRADCEAIVHGTQSYLNYSMMGTTLGDMEVEIGELVDFLRWQYAHGVDAIAFKDARYRGSADWTIQSGCQRWS